MSAGDIAERFGCSWPTTSNHLRILTDAGLVQVKNRAENASTSSTGTVSANLGAAWFEEFA